MVDSQKQVIPGAVVTLTHAATTASQNTITDERGGFRFANVQPGIYALKVELPGFKTAIVEQISLQVDSVRRETVILEVGGVTEIISVVSETTHLNTTDASVGNVMSREQIRQLPVEAQNVVHLLSLQPGAVFIPTCQSRDGRFALRRGRRRARRPAERHARRHRRQRSADGHRVYLGDPHDAGSAAGIPRQHLELQRRDGPLERPAGVARHAQRHQPVRRLRRTGSSAAPATSTNEYFLELSQEAAGQESKAPKLDKDIFGGSFGGPIQRNKLFFFANVEQLKEKSESPVVRNVPSNSMRDGVLIYQCAVAGAVSRRVGARREPTTTASRRAFTA